jgi:ankyrin repeat protein
MLKQKADLFYALKANNLYKASEAISKLKLAEDEFLDDKISFISCAILNNCSDLIIAKLLENGCNVNRISFLTYNWPTERQRFNSFEPALITATRHGNLQLVEILLRHGAKINKSDSFHMTALHWASSLNLIDIVKVFFKYNVNVNLTDLKKHTPLEKAILNNHIDIVQVFADNYMINSKCREYLLSAIESSNTEIFRYAKRENFNY